jgi:uncharacterized protein (DUF58 family)
MSDSLPLIPHFAERFIQRFAKKRQPPATHQVEINRHHLYILPTRHGVLFFIVLLLVLFGAINYENSLAFMLAFLLGALSLLGMIYTHQNINKLSVHIGRAEPVFVGQDMLFPMTLSQPTEQLRPAIQLLSKTAQISHAHLINKTSTTSQLVCTAQHRGYSTPGQIKLFSEFPFGLFHAWSWLNLHSRCLVYPAPYPHHLPSFTTADESSGSTTNVKQGIDDFSGIRPYQDGDLPNHMAWKAIAKTGKLQTKLFSNETSQDIWISWAQLDQALDIEHRLSLLCRMVLDASKHSRNFGLDIPGTKISPSHGLQHKQQCLKALALFGL